ncbi:homoserine kinase [Anoxynatronum sibiricum]|uniref:Homoserine kinase n=1 Tax=Anoxynatronum sibiricum TaxID=210623 RepID=A0ABU9VY58_9CLOT
MAMMRVRVPATMANIGPGFDCMGMALNLYNELEVEELESGLIIENIGRDSEGLPTDETHLVVRSMQRVFEAVGRKPGGIHLRVTTAIPVSRGLGSSAACIVGGLVAANELIRGNLNRQELLELAVELEGHPDNVAPALLGGIVVSAGEAGDTSYIRFPVPAELQTLTAIPNIELSTSAARQALPKEVPYADAVHNVGRAALLVAALMQENYTVVEKALDDRLHQPYRSRLLPSLDHIYQQSRTKGLKALIISGAGPTLAYLLMPQTRDSQQIFLDLLAETPEEWEVLTLSGDNEGAVCLW